MHIPVLLEKSVELWASLDKNRRVKPGIYIDATFGSGGHSSYLLKRCDSRTKIHLIGIDRDEKIMQKVKTQSAFSAPTRKQKDPKNQKLFLFHDNYLNIPKIISTFKKTRKQNLPINGVFFDLGVNTNQFTAGRGFSFQSKNDPLDMRFDVKENSPTAADILNQWHGAELEKIFREYGEEKYSYQVATAIVNKRQKSRYVSVADLLETLENALKKAYRHQKIHYATRIFQSLRIAVNQEFINIQKGLANALKCLAPGGRLAAISFHSGEDRIVKNFFRRESRDCLCPPEIPVCRCGHQKTLKIITKKPIQPSLTETAKNPNSRSARLRAAEKI
jgi:16S rRNA (cytosine1402-N4)-methyltransferase